MSDDRNIPPEGYRKKVIERILGELRYEVTSSICREEIEPWMTMVWFVPHKTEGFIRCEFRVRPERYGYLMKTEDEGKLKIGDKR
jgi:hypothetical protein